MAGSAEPSRDPQAPPRIELVNTCPSPQQRTCGPAPHCSSTTRCSFLEASDPCDSPVRNVPSPPPFPRPPTPTPSLKTRVRLDPMSPPGRRLPQLQPPGPDAALQGDQVWTEAAVRVVSRPPLLVGLRGERPSAPPAPGDPLPPARRRRDLARRGCRRRLRERRARPGSPPRSAPLGSARLAPARPGLPRAGVPPPLPLPTRRGRRPPRSCPLWPPDLAARAPPGIGRGAGGPEAAQPEAPRPRAPARGTRPPPPTRGPRVCPSPGHPETGEAGRHPTPCPAGGGSETRPSQPHRLPVAGPEVAGRGLRGSSWRRPLRQRAL
uniref:Basic proline-rich protein-like n=1 Tax=Castor canadensis TaxID=51338 RepID=A0A8B7VGF5_CASCN|nr:basic proline-rich protein-like [Castor canadensis]